MIYIMEYLMVLYLIPSFFFIYINELYDLSTGDVVSFTDDTVIFYRIKTCN